MHLDRAMAGFLGYAIAGLMALFALAVTVMVSWRNWFGLQQKTKMDEKKKKQSSPARGGGGAKRRRGELHIPPPPR
ncbi:MAG: hypothetical protein JO261_08040 [Alphaproteobacteria bacterium]|nr:hypothetical protein [Alphaproteobacteria bacterium]MBV9693635.1 hypothetical protein [Alphaproteobacteria bacterium]